MIIIYNKEIENKNGKYKLALGLIPRKMILESKDDFIKNVIVYKLLGDESLIIEEQDNLNHVTQDDLDQLNKEFINLLS